MHGVHHEKFIEEYELWEPSVCLDESKYISVSEEDGDVHTDDGNMSGCQAFTHL